MVRTLAQRTQSSTTEIDEMIAHLQSATGDLVSAMEKGVSGTGLNQAESTEQLLLKIVNINQGTSTIVSSTMDISEISRETREAAHRMQQASERFSV